MAAPMIEIKVATHTVKDGTLRTMVCESCGDFSLSQLELEESERRAALAVLKDIEAPSGAVLRFARKALGLRQTDLATALDAQPETVSRWESDEHISRTVALAMAHLLTLKQTDPEALELLTSKGSPPSETGARRKKRVV